MTMNKADVNKLLMEMFDIPEDAISAVIDITPGNFPTVTVNRLVTWRTVEGMRKKQFILLPMDEAKS